MDLFHLSWFIVGLFLLLVTISMTRVWYNYRRLCEGCSQIPVCKEMSVYSYPRWAKYLSSFGDRLPPLACLYQIICGVPKYFPGGIFVAWFLAIPHVVLFKANVIQALVSHPAALDKAYEYNVANCFFGSGLVSSGGEVWKSHRKLLTPSFHLSILKGYIPIYNEHALILVNKMQELTKGSWIEIAPLLKACSFDIILDAAIGLKTKCQEGSKEGKMYMESIDVLTDILAHRSVRPWTYIDSIFYLFPTGRRFLKNMEVARTIAKKIIQEKKEAFLSERQLSTGFETEDNDNSKRKTFIEILLHSHFNDKTFTSKDIEDEVNTFIVAGYDTLSLTLNYLLYLVGLDQNIQEKITQEMDSIFQADHTRMVTHEDLGRMKYLECVIKESLRLYPPFPLIGRELYEDVQVDNYKIPKGCVLVYHLYVLHRDPEVFPNPEKFDPERFSSADSAKRHAFAFMPFSAGSRNCLGQKFGMMEMKVILAHIFRNFTVESQDPRDKITFSWNMMLKTVEPIRLRIIPRRK